MTNQSVGAVTGASQTTETGVLVVHGNVLEPTSTTSSFSPCCTFTTALVGGGTHKLQIADHFLNLDVSQATGPVMMLTPVLVAGQLVDTGSVADVHAGGPRATVTWQ